MFRAQQNIFDDVVAKSTDENLTSENWELILDVCDKVNGAESGAKDAVAAMIKRLAHRNANVQLYTLELANALSQNCGVNMHRELASRSFTEALLRLAGDRTTHQQVKSKILERMVEWTNMFSSNPELGVMEQAYSRLKTQNPNLQPPQAPTKRQITELDRQKEEEELQMALKLSIQDKQPADSSQRKDTPAELAGASTSTQGPPQAVPSGTTAATVSRVRALFDFQPSEPGELQFRKGDVIAVLESVYKDWWKGSLRGHTGIFPLNYVEKLSDPTQEELRREAQVEGEVFGEIKNVEKLLALLSTNSSDRNPRDDEEITTLYHSTLAIRPKLIELIGKYTQKKDDLSALNEKFIKARRDYEALLESSMAQPPAGMYGRPGQQPYGYPAIAAQPQHGYPQPQRFYSPQPEAQPAGAPYPYPGASQGGQPPYPSSPAQRHRTPSAPAAHPQGLSQQQTPLPPQEGVPSAPDQYAQYAHHGQRPQSVYEQGIQSQPQQYPQEIGSSAYDSPVETHPPRNAFTPSQGGQPAAPQQVQPHQIPSQLAAGRPSEYPSAPYPANDASVPPPQRQPSYPNSHSSPATQQQTSAQQGSTAPYPYPPQQQQPQPQSQPPAPSHAPPGIPGASTTPLPQSGQYPQFQTPQGQYQSYQRPTSYAAPASAGQAADAASFYR